MKGKKEDRHQDGLQQGCEERRAYLARQKWKKMKALALDENLILRMADGDRDAFTELYRQTSSAVYGFALSILKNRHDAEDDDDDDRYDD